MSVATAPHPQPLRSIYAVGDDDLPYVTEEPPLRYVRMSLEKFLTLPDQKPKVEWRDGWAVFMMAPALRKHGRIQGKICALLDAALPDCDVVVEGGLALDTSRRAPDVVVWANIGGDDDYWSEEQPILAVEVLSKSTRREVLVLKRAELARNGTGQYWIVDPKKRNIMVLRNQGQEWGEPLFIDDANPIADIAVADKGIVHIDLDKLMPIP